MEDKKIVVARVNGTELTNYALIDMMNRVIAIDLQSSHSGPGGTTRKRALDILVLQELTIQDSLLAVPRKQDGQAAMKKAQELFTAINADKDKDPSQVSDATFSIRVAELDKGKEPALYETANAQGRGNFRSDNGR